MIAVPRSFPDIASASAEDAALYRLAEAWLEAPTGQEADARGREFRELIDARLRGAGSALARVFAGAPSVAVARALWRTLDAAWRGVGRSSADEVAAIVFAIPLVLVVGGEPGAEGVAEGVIPGVVPNAAALADVLMSSGGLAGNRSITLADVLAGAEAIDLPQLPRLLAWQRFSDFDVAVEGADSVRDVPPLPLAVRSGGEAVHLRFLVGTAIARAGGDTLADERVDRWGLELTRELARQLGRPNLPVLALPRAPLNPLRALQQGRSAQREVSAQLFASNALRRLRASIGEPVAVLSAHRAEDAPGGGELRLSLSSLLDPREAEGFRCSLFPLDRVEDVATILRELLRDCRVSDVRVLRGIYPDRAADSSARLLFKPDTIPPDASVVAH